MTAAAAWTGSIEIRAPSLERAEWLFRVLSPEAEREVPRARATLFRPLPDQLRIELAAKDTGALRAALNTYLGWIDLAEATLAAAAPRSEVPP
jgi:tRNA threonylcarbamoyladenosine modification (KEOPS) complex  Pcc1 subunit